MGSHAPGVLRDNGGPMSREHVVDRRDLHDAGASEAAEPHHGLPPEVHARVVVMGPHHAPALRALLVAHPGLSTRILAVASPRMGLSAVQTAIASVAPNPEARASADPGPAGSAVPEPASVEAAVAPVPVEAEAAEPEAAAVEAEAPVAASGAGARGPSPAAIATARAYNRRHDRIVAAFNAATDHSCVGANGEPDPVAVWQWQAAHGIDRDGCVGPVSAATAQAAGKGAASLAAPEPRAELPATQAGEGAAPLAVPEPAVTQAGKGAAPLAAPEPAVPEAQPAHASTPHVDGAGGSETTPVPVPVVPARPDGGAETAAPTATTPGAAETFQRIANDNDATLNANLARYGKLPEQRALLDAVIAGGGDAALVKTAFHAYWHVEVTGLDARNVAQSWPVPVLQAIHHQLKLLPDRDARAGAWTKLSLKNNGAAINRGFWGQGSGEGNFSIVGNGAGWTKGDWQEGYAVQLTETAAVGAATLAVTEGGRFKVGDTLALDRTEPARDVVTIAGIEGNTYRLAAPLAHEHLKQATLEPDNATAAHKVNWLDYTVRHEIAHSLDGGAVDGKRFYDLGEWHTNSPLALDQWVTDMGGARAKQGHGIAIPDDMPKGTPESADRSWFRIKLATEAAIRSGAKSLFPANPALLPYQGKSIPIIEAVEAALRGGGGFYNNPTALYAYNSKRFSIDFDHGLIQSHSETALSDRVTNYAISAPAEFFAEAYAVFYEEAGKPGVTDADHGRLIRNSSWRGWMRDHVHDRGHGPAGTGAVPGGHAGGEDQGAHAEGAKRGKKSGNPG
jgi:hypothetical protein